MHNQYMPVYIVHVCIEAQVCKLKRASQLWRQLQYLPTKRGSLALQLMCLTFYIWLDLDSLWSVKWRQPPFVLVCVGVVCIYLLVVCVCVCVCVCVWASKQLNESVSVSGNASSPWLIVVFMCCNCSLPLLAAYLPLLPSLFLPPPPSQLCNPHSLLSPTLFNYFPRKGYVDVTIVLRYTCPLRSSFQLRWL